VTLDPNRATPQVSNIAQAILAELERVRGAKITLTLDIDAEAPSGFPEDVESVVRDKRLLALTWANGSPRGVELPAQWSRSGLHLHTVQKGNLSGVVSPEDIRQS
jgi:hypothetical protein